MSFSFNPGQAGQVSQPSGSEAPPLVVPAAPVITTTAPVEVISPFAYKNRSKSKFGMYFQFGIFAIFGVLAITSIGLFIYQRILIAEVESKKQALLDIEKGFPKLDLVKMQKLSDRIKVVNKIINERASVNTAFKLLESSVLDNGVTYTKFSLSKSKKGKGFDMSFAGETTSYPALYQQIAALNEKKFSKYFSRILISGTGPLDKKGIGTFRADTLVFIEGVDPDTFTLESDNQTTPATTTQNTASTSTPIVPSDALSPPPQ